MSLHNFCAWQKTLNEQGLTHHDVAVLVTRKSICETSGNNCGILGELIVGYPRTKASTEHKRYPAPITV